MIKGIRERMLAATSRSEMLSRLKDVPPSVKWTLEVDITLSAAGTDGGCPVLPRVLTLCIIPLRGDMSLSHCHSYPRALSPRSVVSAEDAKARVE